MDSNIDIILYAILFLLAVITGLLTVLVYQLRKKSKNDYDWSLVYPELAGLDEMDEMEMPRQSASLDKFLHEAPDVQTLKSDSAKPVTGDKLKLNYIESMNNEEITGEEVIGSVFAPEAVEPGEEFVIAAFVHLPSQKEEAEQAAKLIDDEIVKRVEKFLSLKVNKGDEITFKLRIDESEIDDPVQKIIWNGRLESVEFGVEVNEDTTKSKLLAKLEILVNSVPAGNMKFRLKIEQAASGKTHEIPGTLESTSYKRAFISYASGDRNEVLQRTQMLAATGISYFQDIMNLKPGELWENSLYKEIETADVFYLFWSSSAKNSEWVKKEYEYAAKMYNTNHKPEIVPVPIEGPPVAEPPAELSHLHFNDGFLYFIGRQ